MISDRDQDYGIYPTKVEARVANCILRYEAEKRGGFDKIEKEEVFRIVNFVSREFQHDSAEYKNNLIFELTGASSWCRFREESGE